MRQVLCLFCLWLLFSWFIIGSSQSTFFFKLSIITLFSKVTHEHVYFLLRRYVLHLLLPLIFLKVCCTFPQVFPASHALHHSLLIIIDFLFIFSSKHFLIIWLVFHKPQLTSFIFPHWITMLISAWHSFADTFLIPHFDNPTWHWFIEAWLSFSSISLGTDSCTTDRFIWSLSTTLINHQYSCLLSPPFSWSKLQTDYYWTLNQCEFRYFFQALKSYFFQSFEFFNNNCVIKVNIVNISEKSVVLFSFPWL